jgi:hypothetical protein
LTRHPEKSPQIKVIKPKLGKPHSKIIEIKEELVEEEE